MAEARSDPAPVPVQARRGQLRIFLGAAAGVGKTCALLEAAHRLRVSGTDVVVGIIETHGEELPGRLRKGLEQLPPLAVLHHGRVSYELDLDAALARHPAVLVVDDLAHTNFSGVPAPRHPRRWQDVQVLLAAGIDVWTALDVQHLESLQDLIHPLIGARPSETVPDRLLEQADALELVDLPPEELLERLRRGKVHLSGPPALTERIYRRPSLLALREIARRVTERHATPRPRPIAEHVLVALGPDEQASHLVRSGKRIAEALEAPWTVVSVETPRVLHQPESVRNRHIDLLRLAESLGGEAVTLEGASVAATLLAYARTRKITRLILGAPRRRGWRAWLRPSTATQVVQGAQGFDVITIGREEVRQAPPPGRPPAQPWQPYAWAVLIWAACTLVALAVHRHLALPNIVMIYLVGVTVAGLKLGRGPSACIALMNALAFDFFFVPPRFHLGFSSIQYLITFAVMLCIALVVAGLTTHVRQQTRMAGARERRTALLYAMSRELAATPGVEDMARVAVRHVAEVFQCQAIVLLPDAGGRIVLPRQRPLEVSFRRPDLAAAQWVLEHARRAGVGTDTLSTTPGLYIPLGHEAPVIGVLAVLPADPRRLLLPEQGHLLETFAAQIALALERAQMAELAEAARLAAERESLRNTLLASISHDLRTPLSVIAGAASTLSQQGARIEEGERLELARSIETKARDMSELVSNVLDLMRWQSGDIALRRDWQTLDDLLLAAMSKLEARLACHEVRLHLPAELPPVYVDAQLLVQLFVNLLDNVAKYTPEGTPVTVAAGLEGDAVRVTVEDEGPGFPPGDPARLFEKFQRGSEEGPVTGVGLGLAICRAIVRAHGGEIEARQRRGGGACFEVTLPTREAA